MSTEIRVPTLGESVTEATVARWFKQAGQPVAADEPLVELETDKVTLEVNAPASGTLDEIAVPEGGEVEVGALLGRIAEGAGAGAGQQQRAHQPPPQQPEPTTPPPAPPETPPVEEPPTAEPPTPIEEPPGRRPTPEIPPQEPPRARAGDGQTGPAARKLIDEHGL
ncbi:MAG TPA: biotin/lipoyl-containing protein, partial [Geminicoccaceae bacterium]|nr:biotin/lipoyl-containing protein [Geminicoccaceae bacterium]